MKNDWHLKTAVALFVFNRPETSELVFSAVRQAQPPQLFVVADGPRRSRPGEEILCQQTRDLLQKVDWPCELRLNFADENMGCMRRVSSGLDWVFSIVEEAIILEDDCLPHPDFFRFTEELLGRFRDDQRIAHIGGVNFQRGQNRSKYSYYFSRYNHCWGWASWRRAWKSNDNEMTFWPEFRDGNWLESFLGSESEAAYWQKILDMVYDGRIDSWACRWTLSCWREGMISILPSVNLVSNVGFGPTATHTSTTNEFSNIPVQEISFPLKHPVVRLPDKNADEYTARRMFREKSYFEKLIRLLFGCNQ
ncbi:MAG TPA: hemolytic protein HlpA-like protein [Prolixibacteraceae bacterium]|nr:hemolytic protein HlpA-like protein [Prolixibacteraceae bacterium]